VSTDDELDEDDDEDLDVDERDDDVPAAVETFEAPPEDPTDDAADGEPDPGSRADPRLVVAADDPAELAPVVSGAPDGAGAPSTPHSTGEDPRPCSGAGAAAEDEDSSATVDVRSLLPETTGMVSIRAVTVRMTAAPSSSLPACCRTRPRSRRRGGGLAGRWRTDDTSWGG
jgi:hypothetical protein